MSRWEQFWIAGTAEGALKILNILPADDNFISFKKL